MKSLHRCIVLAMTPAVLLVLLCGSSAFCQSDVENAVKQFDSETVKGYIQPLADLYGANISTGTFRSAAIPLEDFHIQVDFIGMGSLVKDDHKTYTVTLPASFSQRTTVQPTIMGPRATLVTDPAGFQYKGSDGMVDASLYSHGVAQLTLGSVAGTEAFFRILVTPALASDKFPKTALYGGGVRHNISQHLAELPVAIAAGLSYNHLGIGDLMDINAFMIGGQVSKSWDVFGVYGGLAWEKSTLKVKYTTSGSNGSPVEVQLDGANTVRLTAGGSVTMGFFKLFADANVASIITFSGGIGFSN